MQELAPKASEQGSMSPELGSKISPREDGWKEASKTVNEKPRLRPVLLRQ